MQRQPNSNNSVMRKLMQLEAVTQKPTIIAVILVKICAKFYNKKRNKINNINPVNIYKNVEKIDKNLFLDKQKNTTKNVVQALNVDMKNKMPVNRLDFFAGRWTFLRNINLQNSGGDK